MTKTQLRKTPPSELDPADHRIVAALGYDAPERPELEMVTLRMPRALHLLLKEAAHVRRSSLNRMCVLHLARLVLDPATAEQALAEVLEKPR